MNVKDLRDRLGISQQELADKTAIPKDRIAKWEQGKGNPKSEDTIKLLTFFNEYLPQNYLINEVEEEYTTTKNISLISDEKDVNDFLKSRFKKKNHDSGPFMVPLVPIAAQAGYSKDYSNTDFIQSLDVYPIVPGIDHHGAIWRYFQVDGDSMLDTFNDGDYVLASQVQKEDWTDLKDWLVYVIVTEEKPIIKRVTKLKDKENWVLTSDNDKYKQTKISISKVKELWKYRRHIGWNASPPKKFEIKI